MKIIPELPFQKRVETFDLLLFSKLCSIFGKFYPILAMLAGGILTPFNGALFRVTALALQKKFEPFATAKTTS
jgi:hypothetical protein